MNIINYISQIILPTLFIIIIVCGLSSKIDIFSSFAEGAMEGLKTVIEILPSLIGLIMAVTIFRSSGAMDILISVFAPINKLTGFPKELASLGDIFKNFGPDSLCAIAASIMMSCTETVFYTLSIYTGAAGIKSSGYTVICAVIANIAGIIASYVITLAFFF